MIYGVGEAPSKIILMGEHAVVYGAPAIAMPFFSLGVKCTVQEQKGETYIQSICYDGPLQKSPDSIQGIRKLIEVTLDHLNVENNNLKIIIESLIPPQRGLGSSAAVSVAIVRALFDAFDEALSIDTLNHLVSIAESIHHFNPSGLDATTILNEKMMVYRRNNGIEYLDSKLEGFLVVADSGKQGNTQEAVREVKQLLESKPHLMKKQMEKLTDLTFQAQSALEDNEIHTLGYLMTQAHKSLMTIGVSDSQMDKYVEVALTNGAFGAKLTGGGKGGCMIALTDSIVDAQKISYALLNAGVKNTWIYNMREVINYE